MPSVFLPKRFSNKPALIVELKCDASADGALAQIRERHYTNSLKDYKGNLILVGINYDKKMKKHTCLIEQAEKPPVNLLPTAVSQWMSEDTASP